MSESYHVPKGTNGNGKINILGWMMATFMLMIQVASIAWMISSMNSTTQQLKEQFNSIMETQKSQQLELNEHELDIKLIQQGAKK